MSFDIDWAFIGRLEGAGRRDGYVPRDAAGRVEGQSGVTIATGFDIGQHDQRELDALFGAGSDLARAFAPYAELRRAAAVEALERRPLMLTAEQVVRVDRVVKARKATALARAYDAAVAARRDRRLATFRALPREAQTVVASVAFQYGTDLARAAPTFWRHAVAQDWAAVERELRAFGDRYPTRRRREADYLAPLSRRARR